VIYLRAVPDLSKAIKVWLPAIKCGAGADVFTLRLAEALQAHGLLAEIAWFNRWFELVPYLLCNVSPPPGTDLVIANSWNAFAFARSGVPLVVMELHCVLDPRFRPYKSILQHLYHELLIRRFAVRSYRKAAGVVAISASTADSVTRVMGVTGVSTIHCWVDTNKFRPAGSASESPHRPFRLLYVGNTSRRKGFDLLAPIMRALGSGFELRFTTGLRGRARGPYPSNMIPLGVLSEEELIRAYQECDALLFPSRFEGFGYVALEAMACGRPVVATNCTSIPEVVEDGVTGILCGIDDVNGFVSACRLLAGNEKQWARMCKAARSRAAGLFSKDRLIRDYAAILECLVAVDRPCGHANS